MFKKSVLVLVIVFYVLIGVVYSDETYPVIPPATDHQIEQIKWAHNQGYVYGILANYGFFKPSPYPINFVLPIINTAWEMGYVEAIIDIQRWEEKDEDEDE